jgi:3-oxoacyl-[acyl-carrier-protein] synthase II
MADKRRVVVTGVGLVSSLGIGTEKNWEALAAGKSGIGPITKFDLNEFDVEYSTRIAGEVKDFDPLAFVEKKDVKKMDVFIQRDRGVAVRRRRRALTVTPDARGRRLHRLGHRRFTTIEREHRALPPAAREDCPFSFLRHHQPRAGQCRSASAPRATRRPARPARRRRTPSATCTRSSSAAR